VGRNHHLHRRARSVPSCFSHPGSQLTLFPNPNRLFGLSYAQNYAQIFLAQGVACGVAAGIVFLPAVSSISHFFRARRATALGFLATGSSIGGVVYPLLLNNSFERIGFGWTVRACQSSRATLPSTRQLTFVLHLSFAPRRAAGFLTLGLLLIACITITTRLPPRRGGPIIDFKHFKDPAYFLFVVAESLIMWGVSNLQGFSGRRSRATDEHPRDLISSCTFHTIISRTVHSRFPHSPTRRPADA
jgi:hypothetical protein